MTNVSDCLPVVSIVKTDVVVEYVLHFSFIISARKHTMKSSGRKSSSSGTCAPSRSHAQTPRKPRRKRTLTPTPLISVTTNIVFSLFFFGGVEGPFCKKQHPRPPPHLTSGVERERERERSCDTYASKMPKRELTHPTHFSLRIERFTGFPVRLPWVIAALCFGWSVFMTVEMLTKEEVGHFFFFFLSLFCSCESSATLDSEIDPLVCVVCRREEPRGFALTRPPPILGLRGDPSSRSSPSQKFYPRYVSHRSRYLSFTCCGRNFKTKRLFFQDFFFVDKSHTYQVRMLSFFATLFPLRLLLKATSSSYTGIFYYIAEPEASPERSDHNRRRTWRRNAAW